MFSPGKTLAVLQLQNAGSVDRETLLVIFVGIIAVFFLILIIALLAGAIYAMRLKRQLLLAIDSTKRSLTDKATPVMNQAHALIAEFTPKARTLADNVVEISQTVRAQVTDIDSTLSHVTQKARTQADRVNGMVSSTLDTTSNVVQSVENGIRIPIREVSGILAGLRAGLDVLSGRSAVPIKSRVRQAEERIESWEDDVASEARRASLVNQPVGNRTASGTPAARSLVEAGEEIVTSSILKTEATSDAAVDNHGGDLRERRPI